MSGSLCRRWQPLAAALALAGAFQACGSGDMPPAEPSGSDAGPGADAASAGDTEGGSASDGAVPIGRDAALDARFDAGYDAGIDAAFVDAGRDASPPISGAWPGIDNVMVVDDDGAFGKNVSGLAYQPAQGAKPAVLWAVQNEPSTLFRLLWNGTVWRSDPGSNWGSGKTLKFPDGTGAPDAEDLVVPDAASPNVYVVSEKDGSGSARPSILLYDVSAAGGTLVATREWNLASDLPPGIGAKTNLEAITFLPDAYLLARSFRDERLGKKYSPADYPNHAGGLFMVGLEETAEIYIYALDHVGGGFQRLAVFSTGLFAIMSLAHDRDVGSVWAACDDKCDGALKVFDIDPNAASATFGRFVLRATFTRPGTMGNLNNEGITFAPESTCVAGHKAFFWADDGEDGDHVIRRDAIPCGRFY